MDGPHLTHGMERAELLLRGNRVAELTFDDLTASERAIVLEALKQKLVRAHRRAVRAHVVGVLLTVGFLAVGAVVFVIGPMARIGPTGNVRMTELGLELHVWLAVIAVIALGGAAGDYVIRRRRRLASMWERESRSIADAIARAR
ncbi:MAG: hypothetical protein O2973_07305 [Gemmatimonadetes bacterium]|nr:hypothetical protein [Gemmatimonadota bacterium]